jgi:quercetin dioxygenase-like cupin family protein
MMALVARSWKLEASRDRKRNESRFKFQLSGWRGTSNDMRATSYELRAARFGLRKEAKAMNKVFPDPIRNLPQANVPLDGATAFLSQSDTHQIVFMEFEKDIDVPEHSHAAQMGIVVEGKIELTIEGEKRVFSRGDRYYIPAGTRHSARIYAGYADVTYFDESRRYAAKGGSR